MVENAIDRLKDRQRKKVNPRNASLNTADDSTTESSQIVNQPSNNDLMTESSQTISHSNNNDSMTRGSQTTNQSNSSSLIAEGNQTVNQLSSNDSTVESGQITNQSNSNDSTVESSQITNQSNSNDSTVESSQTINQLISNDSTVESSQTINQLISNDSTTGNERVQEPIRRTVRLDPQIDDYMDILCKEHRVTRETLIEAAMVVCSKNQRTLNKVITDAQDRYKDRKRKGELKKLETMSKKLKGM